jgi:acetyl/propionyl-CoA carboxylase alpha subunit
MPPDLMRVTGRGVATTRDFLLEVTADRRFAEARHDTSLVDRLTAEDGHATPAGAGMV